MLANGSAESVAAYALCYKCHDRDSILGDIAANVTFSEHQKHVVDLPLATGGPASCAACHDPHGVEPAATSTSHLINLNLEPTPSGSGRLEFVDGALPYRILLPHLSQRGPRPSHLPALSGRGEAAAPAQSGLAQPPGSTSSWGRS